MNENNKEIIIKIEEGIQTKAFKPENIIHKDAYERIKNLITQNLKEAKEYKKKLEEKDIKEVFERVHNTITINGERGAGKTSFMLSIKKEYEKDKEIEVLDILDPTLISTRQHVFVLLLAMIEKRVNEKFNGKCREKKFDDSYKDWKKSLEDLAKGLNQLDGIGNNPYDNDLWDDSALIMARGLDLAKAGIDLEKRFHIFVNKSLKLLGKKAFLLFIDDIDTDFSKGWEVLEILRKYITTPQIIPIMAGNFELYENLVRKEKSKLFKELIEFEKNFGTFKNKKVLFAIQMDELTQQYLIKVLQPINMLNLHKLGFYITFSNYIFRIEDKKLEEFIINKLDNYFVFYYEKEYIKNIINIPLRSVMQFLYFLKYSKNKKEFIENIRNLFVTYFVNLGIEIEFFDGIKDNEKGIDYFVSKFVDLFDIEDVKMFLPNTNDDNKNKALIFIPQVFNIYLNINRYLEWGIKVPLQFYLISLIENKEIEKLKNLLLINKFINDYEKINHIIKSLYYFDFGYKKKPFLYVKTFRHKDYVFKEIGESVYEEIKKELEKDEKYFLFILPYIGLKLRNVTYDAFSPLYILDTTFKYLGLFPNEVTLNIKIFLTNRLKYENIINISLASEYEAEWTEENEYEEDNELNINNFYQEWIKIWFKTCKKINLHHHNIHLLKFNNIFYSFIDRNYKIIKPNLYCDLGEYIETEIFIFLNEVIANYINDENISLFEIKTPASIKRFFKNLKKLKEINENIYYSLMYLLISPFIYPYISDKKDENKKKDKSIRDLIKLELENLEQENIDIFKEINEFFKNNKDYLNNLNINSIFSKLKIMDGKCSKIPDEVLSIELKKLKNSLNTEPTFEEFKEYLKTKKRSLPSDKKLKSIFNKELPF